MAMAALQGCVWRPVLASGRSGVLASKRWLASPGGPTQSSRLPAAETVDVVICGSGMAGCATAAALGASPYLAEHRIVMVDVMPNLPSMPQSDEPYRNRVVALRPAAVRFLKSFGAWDIIEQARAKPYTDMKVWDACAPSAIQFAASDVGQPNLGHIVENSVVQAAVRHVLDAQGRVEGCWGTRAVSIEKPADTDGLVTVRLENERVLRTRLLIGADGVNSFVRKAVGIQQMGWEYHQMGVVATLHIDPSSLQPTDSQNSTAWQRFLPTGPVAILPLSDTVSSLVWSTYPGVAKTLMEIADKDFVTALNTCLTAEPNSAFPFADGPLEVAAAHRPGIRPPTMPPVIKAVEANSRASFPFGLRHCKSYVANRTALVADAAHRIHPLAGQGINLGLGDAEDLAKRIINEAFCGLDVGNHTMLTAYDTSRKSANSVMITGMDVLKRLYTTDFPPIVWLRALGLNATNSVAPLKRLLVEQAMGV